MRYVKLSLFLLFILFLIYVILTGAVSVILYRNIPTIKSAIQETLGAEDVQISGFFNVPFRYVKARNVELDLDEETSATIEEITIHYRIWNYITKGLEHTFTEIDIGAINLKSSVPALSDFINSFEMPSQENREEVSGFTTTITISSFKAGMELLGQINSEFSASNIYVSLQDNRMKIHSTADLVVKLTNEIEYLNSNLEIAIDSKDFKKGIAEAAIKFNQIDFGGIPLFEDELVSFTLSNDDITSIESDTFESYIVESNNVVLIRLERLFSMDYDKYEEHQLMEYILENGNYKFTANAVIDKHDFAFTVAIDNQDTGGKPLYLKGKNASHPFQVEGKLETEKYGMIDIDLDFIEGESFPKGTAQLRLISFVEGLKFGGKAIVNPIDGSLLVRAENLRINGGLIGDVDLFLGFTNGTLFLAETNTGTHNAFVEGFVFKNDFNINIEATDVPGTAVVSNIKVDALGISSANYDAWVHIYSDENTNFNLDGEFIGYLNGKKYNDGVLTVFNEDLSIPRLYFDEYNLLASADFSFLNPSESQSIININGYANYQDIYQSPFKVNVNSYNDLNRTQVQVNLTNQLLVFLQINQNDTEIEASLNEFDLEPFGYPGIVTADLDISIPQENYFNFDSDINYRYQDYDIQIQLDSDLEEGILTLNELILTMNDQELVANGSVWQSKDRWNGKIYFEDEGNLIFIASPENIKAQLVLNYFQFSNPKQYLPEDVDIQFIPDESDIFITTELNVNGALTNPNFDGDLTIVTELESEELIVSLKDFSKISNFVNIDMISMELGEYLLETDAWMKLSKDSFVITSSGYATLGESISTDIDLLFQKKTDSISFTYKINSLTVAEQNMGDFQGGVVYDGKEYILYRNTDKYGVSGVYSQTNDKHVWDLEILSDKLQGNFSGSMANEQLSSTLSIKGDMEMFSFARDLFEQLDGEIKIALNLNGKLDDPEIDGDIRFYNTSIAFDGINSEVQNAQFIIPIFDGKLLFNDIPLPTTTGDFYITGYVDISEMGLSYLDMTISPSNKNAYIGINISDPTFNIEGESYISMARIYGSPPNFNLSGDITLKNTSISVGLISAIQSSGAEAEENPLINIYFDVSIATGLGVKFYNEVINVILEQDQTLDLDGSFGNDTFGISGDININRGTITYLGRDFKIDEGQVTFSGDDGDLIPYATISTSARDKDNTGETIDIYLTFEGKLTTISIEDFYTVPEVSNAELYALLGVDSFSTTATNGDSSYGRKLLASGLNTTANYLLNPVSQYIRRTLGLDMFVLRTGFLGNLVETTNALGDIGGVFSGTSISVGKYLFSNLFLEYELSWEQTVYSTWENQLNWLHTFGVGWDFKGGVFVGYKLSPYLENRPDPIYEHRLEFNLHSTF